ncbi:MAG: phosphopentomutase [Ruminococcaceae bacterium]|nr:phosphopentomutase [Oscillospiraceae bacterium]
MKRIFLIVLDSLGIGALPDAESFGDAGSDTLRSISASEHFYIPNLLKLGISHIEGLSYLGEAELISAVGRAKELSAGKDTTVGHWEIAGLVSEQPFPTYPDGFPESIIKEFETECGRGVLCNKPYSGTDVIRDYGKEHLESGKLIVYTSGDSVFQIAAHETAVPPEELYKYCRTARRILKGKHCVARVIARPFEGEHPYVRTSRRHDFSAEPGGDTMLDAIKRAGLDTIGVGKIHDIFAGRGLTEFVYTEGNTDGMAKTDKFAEKDFNGLCFVNLVDFDSKYGHRNDVDGYAKALSEFDLWLGSFVNKLGKDDVLIISADHGCDPATVSTDHSREYVPIIIYGSSVKPVKLGTRESFSDIAASICDMLGVDFECRGVSMKEEFLK